MTRSLEGCKPIDMTSDKPNRAERAINRDAQRHRLYPLHQEVREMVLKYRTVAGELRTDPDLYVTREVMLLILECCGADAPQHISKILEAYVKMLARLQTPPSAPTPTSAAVEPQANQCDELGLQISAIRAKQGEAHAALERLRAAQVEHTRVVQAFGKGSTQAAVAQAKQDDARVAAGGANDEARFALERLCAADDAVTAEATDPSVLAYIRAVCAQYVGLTQAQFQVLADELATCYGLGLTVLTGPGGRRLLLEGDGPLPPLVSEATATNQRALDSARSGGRLQHPEQEVIEEARALLTAYCGATCDLTVNEARVILLRDTEGQDFSCDAAPLRAKLQPLVDGFLRNLLRGDGLLVCPRGLTFCLLSSVGRETAAIGKLYSGPARLITGEQVLVDGFEVLGVLFGVQLISQGEHGLQLKLRQQLGDELSKVIREAQAAGRRY